MRQNRQEDYMDKILDLCKDLAVQSGVKNNGNLRHIF